MEPSPVMTGGLVDRHYGLRIRRGKNKEVYVDCNDYILDKCKELEIPAGTQRTPMSSDLVLPKIEGTCNDSELQKRYRSLIGSLMHAAVTCRPDVAFAVGALSRHLVHPTAIHIKAAEHAFQYLRSTADLQLCYGRFKSAHAFYGTSDALV